MEYERQTLISLCTLRTNIRALISQHPGSHQFVIYRIISAQIVLTINYYSLALRYNLIRLFCCTYLFLYTTYEVTQPLLILSLFDNCVSTCPYPTKGA